LATSPTSQSATTSGAAKDDAVGLNGDYNFTIKDLLANDPGGAAKVDIGKQFFFGDVAPGSGIPSIDAQVKYLADHGITAHVQNGAFVSFDIGVDAKDFNYFVQIGNKGTWSEAHVDVTAPVAHAGDTLFFESFDNLSGTNIVDPVTNNVVASTVDLGDHGWTGGQHTELGADGYEGIAATSGNSWFDTQNSPGGANISHTFTDSTAAVKGKTAVLSFDIGTQSTEFNGQHYQTDPAASFEFMIDGKTVATYHATDFTAPDQLQHFDIDISSYAGLGDTHTLTLVDTTANAGYAGFAIDSVKIHDWII
jgi:hypothetical protein